MILTRGLRLAERWLAWLASLAWLARRPLPGPAPLTREAVLETVEAVALHGRRRILGQVWLPARLEVSLPPGHEDAAVDRRADLAAAIADHLRAVALRRHLALAGSPRIEIGLAPAVRRPSARWLPAAHEDA